MKAGGAIMERLVEIIAKSLVDHPDQVTVHQEEDARTIIIKLRVAQEDMGKVIGKQGRIAKAIRAVVSAAGTRSNKRLIVDIDSDQDA
jgi:uncharacterized protein